MTGFEKSITRLSSPAERGIFASATAKDHTLKNSA